MTKLQKLSTDTRGFTLIELMIATAVFSVILMISLAGFIQIGRMYYRGLSATRTQEVTRAVIDDVSREIQFGASKVEQPDANTICIGSKRYTFDLHKRIVDTPSNGHEANNALRKDSQGANQNGCAIGAGGGATELLGENMRLAKFSVTPVAQSNDRLWNVTVKVVFGEDDLLDGFQQVDSDPYGDSSNVVCKGGTFLGGQFCATAEISTVVYRRLK